MFIPIFIHIKEKSDKEIREEMARESKWRKMIEEDDARRRARKREEKELQKIKEKLS